MTMRSRLQVAAVLLLSPLAACNSGSRTAAHATSGGQGGSPGASASSGATSGSAGGATGGAAGATTGAGGAAGATTGAGGASGAATGTGGELDGGIVDASAPDAPALDAPATQVCLTSVTTQHLATGAHDPSMIHAAGGPWYLFVTGGTLNVRSSTSLLTWTNEGNLFPAIPGWVATELGQAITDLWAPDVSYFNGQYHVYYAGSVFGSNHSVIGLATNTTLDPKGPGFQWVDDGLVIESNPTGQTDDWNAIDPNLTFDSTGNPWLVFGSFWSGIKLRRIDPTTGKLSTADATLYALAERPGGGAIEASSIVLHNGYYYLFVSFDLCCEGVNSTYRTMVGRATSITGPYTDQMGQAMLAGNAEQLLVTTGRYIGPGGGTAFHDGACYYYVYHYYDGQANGAPTLEMRPIGWSADDWPILGDALWE
jgi:arabinan endo-1,5-alpha-L-arabinosidase